MKKVVKVLSVIISIAIIISVLGGCGANKSAKQRGKYTYWVSMNETASQTLQSYEDMFMYQELEKRTGVDIDFIHPTKGSTGSEAFQILLTSTDMPDMIEYDWKSYPGGPDRAIEDKVIISLNKYLEDFAPNYYSYMEGDKAADNNNLYRVQSVTQNGNYYGFKNLNMGTRRGFGGIIIRKDLLDRWGLDVPVTIDDWTEVFKTAKENGVKKPLTGSNGLFAIIGGNFFNTAWNVGKTFHIENDKVVFALDKPEYKDYVAKMADWFKKGYIDVDYITNESNVVLGNMTNGTSIACHGFIGGTMGKLIPAMVEKNPEYNIVGCPYPVLNEGDIPWFQEVQAEAGEPSIAITYQCGKDDEDRYKEAMKWCDYLYSDEGIVLKSFGVEGKTFKTIEKDDGIHYEYIITSDEEQAKIGATSVGAALWHYFRPANSPGFNQHDDYLNGFYPYQQQLDAIDTWNKYVDEAKKHVMPTLAYTDEEATRTADITSRCRERLDAAISKIICNEASINTYDDAVKTAKKEGYDELTKIHQAAYDRYLSAIK